MNVTLHPGALILFTLLAQGIFAALILFLKPENKRANRYMALLILLLTLWLSDSFFRAAGIYQQHPTLYFLPIYYSLGFGPLIYYYTRSLTGETGSTRIPKVVHFLPVALQGGFYLFLRSQDYSFRRNFWFDVHQPYTYDLELILSFTSLLIYLIASRRLINRYKHSIANSFSSVARITLNWLGGLHLVLALLAGFWLLESCARLVWGYYPVTPLSAITIGCTILLMAGGGILQQDLRQITAVLPSTDDDTAPVDPALVERVQTLMREKAFFLQQELSLKDFATEVGRPTREVSRAINQGLGVSFLDFVNRYRVDHCKELLRQEQFDHLSLLGIALDSGFNSKSTFNRVFKKFAGVSPSEYRKAAQNT